MERSESSTMTVSASGLPSLRRLATALTTLQLAIEYS
jgi:hypothetical protein